MSIWLDCSADAELVLAVSGAPPLEEFLEQETVKMARARLKTKTMAALFLFIELRNCVI